MSVQRFENTSEVLFAHLRDRGKLEDLKLCVAGMRFHILNRLVDPSILVDIVLIHIKFLILSDNVSWKSHCLQRR